MRPLRPQPCHGEGPGTPRGPVRGVVRVRRLLVAVLVGVLLAPALVGCAGEAGTEITPAPASLVRISAEADSVRVGEETDPPLAVRVENGLGEPLEGVPVRFVVASGPGAIVPSNVAVSNEQGLAEATFSAGSQFGRSRVRADVPSATNVSSVSFDVTTLPAQVVSLGKEGGDAQQAEVRSQLPLPFALQVTTSSGTPAGGVPVVWSLGPDGGGASLSTDTTFTDAEGHTRNLLTLGSEPVDHTIRAFAAGGVETDTVSFSAAALVVLNGPSTIDSVSPDPIRAGETAVLYGAGFGRRADNVEVRVEGTAARTLEVDGDRVRFRVPEFSDRCLPTRRVGLRALVRGEAGEGAFAILEPAPAPVDLAVGEVRTLGGASSGGCLVLRAAADAAEYLVVAGSTGRSAAGATPLRLVLRTAEGRGVQPGTGDEAEERSASVADAKGEWPVADAATRLREAVPDALRERGFLRGERSIPLSRSVRPAAAPAASAAVVGDTLRYRFAAGDDLTLSCQDTTDAVRAVVRFVGRDVLLAEDVTSPEGGFTSSEWTQIGRELDDVVVPTDSAYFGAPADIDGNGRITYLFTPKVNRLTPRGSQTYVGGFFLPLDLVDSGDAAGSGLQGENGETCPASNEGEILYMAVADPEAQYGAAVRRDQALRRTRSVGAHELVHLLSAEQRLVYGSGGFEDLDETWLQEALAHLGEEMVGLRLLGAEPHANLGWDAVSGDRATLDLFNTYFLNNFARLSFFMRTPTATPALAEGDPGGLASLQMRGFGWAFVRWLVDRHAGGDEEELVRALSSGGSGVRRGVDNVETAADASWESLAPDFLTALALDDGGVQGEAGRRGFSTWNLRSIFGGLHQNRVAGNAFPLAYPLRETVLPFGSTALDFVSHPSTGAYVRLRSPGDGAGIGLTMASQSGGPAPAAAGPTLTVVRLR